MVSQRLKVKECISQLERMINSSIIDYVSVQDSDSIIILINVKDRIKWYKNKPIIKKLSKQVGKYLNYISLSCSIKQVARQCVFPVEIEDIVLEKNNGEITLVYLIDQRIKDSIMNKYESKFRLSKILLQKHYAIDNVRVKGIKPEYYEYYGKRIVSEVIR
ncbi:MAG: hypothetical protein ACXADY_02915 [Candidatus Hodarchaeales archaeon]